MKSLKGILTVVAVFAPFIMVGYAWAVVPSGLAVFSNIGGLDWIWFIALGGMMVVLYYVLAVYLVEEDQITVDFNRLDKDHDGYISPEEASTWQRLARAFGRYDTDHDGKLSRLEFEAFEHSSSAH